MDYDGGSSDDDERRSFKKNHEDRENGSSSRTVKTNGYSYSPHRSTSTHNGNGHYSSSNGHSANGITSSSNSSNGSSSRGSSPKNGSSNGKYNGEQNGYSNGKNKDKWQYNNKMRVESSEKIYTKASVSNRGWYESKNTSSPSSYDVANGWSVSDNLS